MKLLICNQPIDLNFSTLEAAYITRALIVMTFEENGYTGFLQWENICRKHSWIKKSYESATKTKI